ncbi:diacylglycerol/lipid kinase family protein [Sphingomonas bacterium]|uniref:diacylglycerol/lipid kinase family protein n=1 Tax=Sphingomonas bacterium TaxID=1895847 RepID=UPI0015771EFA|nr:diacylglycerol kinase family protein [Sphingomonas bacterium]
MPVLVNVSGGAARRLSGRLRDDVEAAFAVAGVPIALELLDGAAIPIRAAALAGAPVVVVGGGDGTLGGASGALAVGGSALGILPLGTRNHLAEQLDIPADLPGAARVIAGGITRRIDLGRVNGTAFVNNAVIGLYPQLVREREALSAPRWLATLPAAARALGRMRHHRLRIRRPGEGRTPVVTPMLFVGNGHYRLDAGVSAGRESLDDGKLSLYAVASRRRLALVGFALRALMGRADPDRDFAALGDLPAFVVEGRSRRIDVALDGEVMRLAMPLRFESLAGALAVVAPALREGSGA